MLVERFRARTIFCATTIAARTTYNREEVLKMKYSPRVPDELMDRLRHAAARFHESREHLETAMNGSEFRHQERVNAASEEFREAERAIEQIEAEIQSVLSAPV
jgi:hypothetical protein